MTWQQGLVLAGLVVLVVELVRARRPPALVFGGVAGAFVLLGQVSLAQGLRQLVNTGLVTVVVLLLLSVVLDKARLLEQAAERLVRGPYRVALTRLTLATAAYSAFLNNTAVVASLLGPLRSSRTHAPSRLLLPMCYAASLGGILTLVGTSTNLLVNSLLVGRNLPPLHLFDLFPVGMLIVVACTATMVLACPLLLKDRRPAPAASAADCFLEAEVTAGSPMIGRTVEANGLRHLGHLYLAELLRDGQLIAPVDPGCVLRSGDLLVFAGDVTRLDLLAGFPGLKTADRHFALPTENLVEVMVARDAGIVGRNLRESGFRERFDAAVLALRRGPERFGGPLASIALQGGDALVLAVGPHFDERVAASRDLVVVSRRAVQKFMDPRKGLFALGAFGLVIGLSAFGIVDFLKGLFALLAVFLALGLLRTDEIRRHLPLDIVVIIASALVLSDVMVDTGTADLLAGGLLAGASEHGPYAALALVLVVTWILTELMSNNAAAALAFPVALGVAQHLKLDAMPFVMAVLYGASCSFVTPYGYQTNLMVMAPGRYGLGDFARTGLLVSGVFLAVALTAIPVFFPFAPSGASSSFAPSGASSSFPPAGASSSATTRAAPGAVPAARTDSILPRPEP